MFLSDDPVKTGPVIKEGEVQLPMPPGIGCVLSLKKLDHILPITISSSFFI
ncbi:hypothetical protein M5W83_02815 [Paenibacillus thiaminolyticus]|uniref:Enolase C-terminal domain-containing protein n=1 Tax=Paenibacillus thiaminolyticus TaxID=49283 RepID=A0ABT4FPJ1_PANTH|nr:hypothetical protein [Paenibacillus thiaminolyticus]MCY9606092.1 hypothetical protein [Paenibacillus thiaminolyticus]MCY9612478.1 hypothetical protein [Paenibacillus thiaminolyticus]MCY9634721.1 hypothetical protein [Paenibacillus thiaminolyticus]MCY9739417.1 hypothetical protein [Paenibacillus thiaminolyticus]MEC0062347.1 hypothetical protein [Paenibacillus thiaminolyticus]